jgi:hypothetical protein
MDDVKNNFREGLEYILDKSPKCLVKMFLGDFSANVGSWGRNFQTNNLE